MTLLSRAASWGIVAFAAALLAMSWISAGFAQTDGDGDGFDGDELVSVSILLGVGVLAVLAWGLYRRRAPKSPK